jgi:diguanylate cyclase (GGDEF)-like protein/PAS domain S-box-containing protein
VISQKKDLVQANELRQQAEASALKMADLTPGQLKTLSPQAAQKIWHDLRVHQIELEMQNEELRRTQEELAASRAQYFDLYDLAPVSYCTISNGGLIVQANLTAVTLLGLARRPKVKQPISQFLFKEDQDTFYFMRKQLLETGDPQTCELRVVKHDGALLWVHLMAVQVEGDSKLYRIVLNDISERKLAEQCVQSSQESLRESAVWVKTILDNVTECIITMDAQGLLESFNQEACNVFSYQPEEVLGRHVSMLISAPHKSQHTGDLERLLMTEGDVRSIGISREIEGQRKDGSVFPLHLWVSKILRKGKPVFIGLLRDVTQRNLDAEEIRHLAFYDSLTGLPNRRLLTDRLQQAVATSARTGRHGALMFLDLDHFKQLNDGKGHAMGDLLLQKVATRLKTKIREADSVARLGGDEFVILLESLSSQALEAAAQARVIANSIHETLGKEYDLDGYPHTSTPSIGITLFLQDQETMEELLKKADVALYQAKAAGRNTARFFDPAMQAASVAHVQLEEELRQGHERNEFILHYQIQVDSAGAPTGVEALVRWNHPVRGLMPPDLFIPLAEESGLILSLGQWVLETACIQLVQFSGKTETAHWTMAINVSASQFAQADFVANVTAALKKTGADPSRLKLELTESILMCDVEAVIVKMNALKAYGVRFSLDDFGTGFSSLSCLKRLPLERLKIDKSFINDILTDPNDAVIVRAVVALGHSLGLQVLAEGVETIDQRNLLTSIGCDAFQGYYFGRPAPAK